ncbi:MAG: aminotransferase class I/II-fold pyridoxal phosphate-dependent enzyme [Melioribacteraceae bacterium]|nr:aminotransferase class I/II-fold pyridoxal phosphate-dependent enzyme [Melioribacteraceae bacterium]MCF8356385.1 aminotransferase class I/II-fold pyridoxal phosphate-dependent enzyme [Melioribacteraceae bacterium]MCF8395768.1 aminotransferase class I/II-fold pyridoxal phosphate-dependent enzyme [Melioribacteraceae bacterium]MCF8420889.1 aminotransferase class I/II-fold pyridoxal phosphate-dependent enzyme [Melioribacteraceae bacterium]
MQVIDLRSDTVTKPSEAMRKAMFDAEVGDDIYKEDPTVNKLEEYAANLLGKEAALFVPSGTMGNQLCLNVLTQPHDEVICDIDSHIFHYESGSPAALSGIQIYPVIGKNGIFDAEQVEPVIRPTSAYYMARTKVIEIENTHNRAGGTIWSVDKIEALSNLAKKYNLHFHLDGARIWNASVASGLTVSDYTKYFGTVSCCLSKGLGAPIGSIIAGSKEFITEAYRKRKAWGGGMRQVGVIAAAGLYALKNNIERLTDDHENAHVLAKSLNEFENVDIDLESVQTNIVSFKPLNKSPEQIIAECKENGLLIGAGNVGYLRAVTHMDVNTDNINSAVEIFKKILG